MLVTAGPTVEDIDPVRFVSNRSSGKMGYRLAEAARDRGAKVILVSGPTSLPAPHGVEVVSVRSAQDMQRAVADRVGPATVVIAAAAVSDYRPAGGERVEDQEDGRPGDARARPHSRHPEGAGRGEGRATPRRLRGGDGGPRRQRAEEARGEEPRPRRRQRRHRARGRVRRARRTRSSCCGATGAGWTCRSARSGRSRSASSTRCAPCARRAGREPRQGASRRGERAGRDPRRPAGPRPLPLGAQLGRSGPAVGRRSSSHPPRRRPEPSPRAQPTRARTTRPSPWPRSARRSATAGAASSRRGGRRSSSARGTRGRS